MTDTVARPHHTGPTASSHSGSRTVRRAQVAFTPAGPRTIAVDAVVVLVLLVVAASPLADAYGGWRWALAVGGGVLGGLVAVLVARWQRWGAWPTVLVAAAWYVLLGPVLAAQGALPTPDAVRALATGLVRAWRDSLTAVPLLGSDGVVLVVPLVLGLVGGVLTGTVLWRTRRPGLVFLPVALVLVVAAAFGDRVSPHEAVRGGVLVVAVLLWLQLRAVRGLRISWARRVGSAVAVLAVVCGVATLLHVATRDDVARAVLRDSVEPPFDPLDYASPLARYRAYTKDLADTSLFTVAGVPTDVPVRLATMDRFDGIVWNVGGDEDGASSRFRRVRPPIGDQRGAQITVTVEDYTGVWVPSLGVTESATGADGRGAAGVVGNETGTLAQIGGVTSGAVYRLDAVRPTRPSDPEIEAAGDGSSGFVPPTAVPEVLMKRVRGWLEEGGSTTAGSDALVVAQAFHDQGFYSDGLEGETKSPSGHGTSRIAAMVSKTDMIGNDEQYASAMAMAMQQLGHPARVVIGFESNGGTVTGEDVTAWVEVDLDGLGWVPFDPTPPKDQQPPQEQQDPQPLPQPQVLQPVDPPEEPDDVEQAPPQGAGTTPKPRPDSPIEVLIGSLAWVGKVGALTLPIWLIPVTKLVRRRRRRGRKDPVARVSGGWREVSDRARDLGTHLPTGGTRLEAATLIGADTATLARDADRHVFSPGEPSSTEVDDYWRDVRTALRRLRRTTPWWRRPLAWFSLASIPWRTALGRLAGAPRRAFRRLRRR